MEQNVRRVMDTLIGVGFPESLEWAVQVHLCFAPPKFSVQHEQFKESDQLRFHIWIVRDEGSGGYLPAYYDATLVRPIDIKPQDEAAEHALALNGQMQLVNWEGLMDKGGTATVGDFADLQMVSEIVQGLDTLSRAEEGNHYADMLRLRYWSSTPFESYARMSSPNRSLFEVSQRFHFFDDGHGITLEEAYRFLLHRWYERKVQSVQRGLKEVMVVKGKKAGKG